jgi:hypothetical protein
MDEVSELAEKIHDAMRDRLLDPGSLIGSFCTIAAQVAAEYYKATIAKQEQALREIAFEVEGPMDDSFRSRNYWRHLEIAREALDNHDGQETK